MEPWANISEATISAIKCKRRNRGEWYDNIFCFDTETTSAFITPEGKIIPYDYTLTEVFYTKCEKIGFMYIWMFSVDDTVYYGRTWQELTYFMQELNKILPEHKIVYVHNLSFDWQGLRNAIPEWDSVFCRNKRKVLTADVGSYHFRCSYFLTNMSLDQWAKQKKLPVTKAKGQLDYNKIRTPLTELTPEELDYCERDLLVMYHGLLQYRERYKHVHSIPLTQTGEVRVDCAREMKTEYWYRKRQAGLMPKNLKDYNYLMSAFFGGDTHANYIHADQILHHVKAADISSDYPWQMISKKYPQTNFVDIRSGLDRFRNDDRHSFIVTFEVYNFESKYFNTFLSRSRCRDIKGAVCDNGRVLSASYALITFTNIDFELFLRCYEYQELKIIRASVAMNNYLNPKYCRYVLSLYKDKTTLKGIEEAEAEYQWKKQLLNGLYGDCVTRDFSVNIVFNGETFESIPPTEESYYQDYIKKQKRKDRLYKSANIGIFVTAYARKMLWDIILQLDHQVVYFDTDSVKYLGNDHGIISGANIVTMLQYDKIAERLGVDPADLAPEDKNGKPWPIGVFAPEPKLPTGYTDFKTCGSKKYALVDAPGDPIEITISGVPKKNSIYLSSVDDLRDELVFTPEQCGKSISFYCDDQPEVEIDGWKMTDKYGICLQPTGHTVGLTLEYMLLLAENRDGHRHDLDFMDAIERSENGKTEIL